MLQVSGIVTFVKEGKDKNGDAYALISVGGLSGFYRSNDGELPAVGQQVTANASAQYDRERQSTNIIWYSFIAVVVAVVA